MLKSRSTFPPGGWAFHQPQTGWDAPGGATFDEVVSALIKHREANPRFKLPTDRNVVEMELEFYTELRVRRLPGADTYLTSGAPSLPKTWPPQSQIAGPEAAASTVGGVVSRVKAGIGVMWDWFGTGMRPVARELANRRAEVCAGCPKNRKSSWVEWAKDSVASGIKTQLEVKNEMSMTTDYDEEIQTCDACLCWLPLKVWTPLVHIRVNMGEDVKAALDPRCWVLSEP